MGTAEHSFLEMKRRSKYIRSIVYFGGGFRVTRVRVEPMVREELCYSFGADMVPMAIVVIDDVPLRGAAMHR